MNDEQYSYRRTNMTATASGTNLQTDPAMIALQIRSLVANPDAVPKTAARSPLFQVAMQLEVSRLPEFPSPAATITGEIFAHVRKEALRACNKRKSNQPITPKRQTVKT